MKVKPSLILITFIILTQTMFAQTDYSGKLEFVLLVDQTEWNIGSRVTAKVTVKNLSEKQTEILFSPNFELVKKEIPKGASLSAYTYVSVGDLKSSVFTKVLLNKDETQSFEIDLTKFVWRRSPESLFLYGEDWHKALSSGEYELSHKFWFYYGEDKKKQHAGSISSNKIDVKLNSLE